LAEPENLGPIVLVSDRFHMLRSLSMVQELGLRVYSLPTTTSPIEDATIARLYHTSREVEAYATFVLMSNARALGAEVGQPSKLATKNRRLKA
jgi:uncharacterized SAM-binding protein YcdF (DUF218 family)